MQSLDDSSQQSYQKGCPSASAAHYLQQSLRPLHDRELHRPLPANSKYLGSICSCVTKRDLQESARVQREETSQNPKPAQTPSKSSQQQLNWAANRTSFIVLCVPVSAEGSKIPQLLSTTSADAKLLSAVVVEAHLHGKAQAD